MPYISDFTTGTESRSNGSAYRVDMKLAQSKYYICYQGFTNASKYNCSQ